MFLAISTCFSSIFGSLLALSFRPGHLVDNPLDQDRVDVDAAGYVGQKLGDEVVGGRNGQGDAVAFRAGGQIGLPSRNVEVADLVVDGEAHHIGVVHHALAVVALGPDNLIHGVGDAALDGGVGHAMVVGVLARDGWDEEGAEELAGDVLGITDAHVTPKSFYSRGVSGVRLASPPSGCAA